MKNLKDFFKNEIFQEFISASLVVVLNLIFTFLKNKLDENFLQTAFVALALSSFPAYETYISVKHIKTRKIFLRTGGKSGKIISCKKREKDFLESERNKRYILTAKADGKNYEISSDKRYKKGREILFEVKGYSFPKISDLKCFKDTIQGTLIFAVLCEIFAVSFVYIFVVFQQ